MVESQPWKNSFQEAFKNSSDLYHYLGDEWDRHPLAAKDFPVFIPIRLAKKIKRQGPDGVLAREFLPHQDEINPEIQSRGLIDPIGDKNFLKAPQLIHRYETRALFTPTSLCPVHCRYCFRRNELAATEDLFQINIDQTVRYLKNHPEISEIIFTGGDPLTLSSDRIAKYLDLFSNIESIQDVRFHTRYPVILPERIDHEFLNLLDHYGKKFRTLSLAIHVNHVDEFDDEVMTKLHLLARSSVQLLSQTVLLKGVNDRAEDLINLINLLIKCKIRPYYLHHPDQVKGGLHFYIPIEKGRRLYAQLRDKLPGWALPHYVLDIPEGPGKVTLFNPEDFYFSGQVISKNGKIISHREPDSITL